MISDQGESPGEILTATAHFKVISLFCLHRTSDKIHPWKLFVHRKIFAPGKIKSGRKSLVKKKKTRRLKEDRKFTILSRKENIPLYSLMKATGTGRAPRWRPDFR